MLHTLWAHRKLLVSDGVNMMAATGCTQPSLVLSLDDCGEVWRGESCEVRAESLVILIATFA